MKLLQRLDKDKITFKAIEKYRHGLWKTISKHLEADTLYWADTWEGPEGVRLIEVSLYLHTD